MFSQSGQTLQWSLKHETLQLQPWGPDCFRVRCTMEPAFTTNVWALVEPPSADVTITLSDAGATFVNGSLTAKITNDGHISFLRSGSPDILFEEYIAPRCYEYRGRFFRSHHGGLYHAEARFQAYDDELLYGLGQHQHDFLNQKGCVLELHQKNSEVSIPFLFSNRGYGLLWNNPAVGSVELARNCTRWIANATREIDYVVITGDSPADIMSRYADCTGKPRMMPEWAAGFWQCKLRYETQDELLTVAREYKKRKLPISVIVVDYFHWTKMGDWKFDPKCWPDPKAMVDELNEMGIKTMVSIWPTVNPDSENFEAMERRGLLARSERGCYAHHRFSDTYEPGVKDLHYIDTTNPETRSFVWDIIKRNYYSLGVKTFWIDACEPECKPDDPDHIRYHLGNGWEVGNSYPFFQEMAFCEGMQAEGQDDILLLCRSAWAGSQRFGTLVWSGDIHSDFLSLRKQLKAGLNIAMSGIPWWTTDIGGFYGGKIDDPAFRELIVRWFQFAIFCPVFRLHGFRDSWNMKKGGDNEVWSFGDQAYDIISQFMFLRERLKPYILDQMRIAHETGSPVMRPMFFDFPQDILCWTLDDQFMFGPSVLVAPVLYAKADSRDVYLPEGTWYDAWSGAEFHGPQTISVEAPLNRIPVFVSDKSLCAAFA